MNLASGNAAQNITGAGNNNSQLGSLALGLTGQSGTSSVSSNPFLNSFYGGLGSTASGANSGNGTSSNAGLAFLGF